MSDADEEVQRLLRAAEDAKERQREREQAAEDAKQREKERVAAAQRKKETEQRAAAAGDGAEPWRNWFRTRLPWANPGILFMFIWMPALMVTLFSVDPELEGDDTKYALAIGWAFSIVVTVAMVAAWLRFRSWRARLPFPLEGWSHLMAQEGIDEDTHWWACQITVVVAEPESKAKSGAGYREPGAEKELSNAGLAAAAALTVFAERAQGHYYTPGGSDDRKEWSVEGSGAKGHANVRVAREIERLCRTDLTSVARHVGPIERVTVTIGGRSYVSRPSSD